ncbi:MAG: tetratricopeptide repeat protein [Ignavibacteria bacterium]|nr:tetratricopeptide repeat protein [Ignavibacteria bacterium]
MKKKNIIIYLLLAFTLTNCKQYDDFTTYFNTYYNANRLVKESESEFEYQDEKRRVTPRVIVPDQKNYSPVAQASGPPAFMQEIIIDQQKLQPVKIKLDSVIIKGSKILARHPKSSFIEGTLFLMSKSFFYQRDWINSQLKCSELVDRFPEGEYSPDAHLLYAQNLIIQRKFYSGKIILSRTVDIAWVKKRYDILSDAFRLEAELALFENDPQEALRPYRQAIAQSDDKAISARWQLELAFLLYRLNRFEEAERMFAKVHTYRPDYLAEFEAYLFQAESLIRLSRFEEAEKIIKSLENNRNYDEWAAYTYGAKMQLARLSGSEEDFLKTERFADSAFVNSPPIVAVYFEKGMDLFENKEYAKARLYFSRTKNARTPFYATSDKMFNLLNSWEQKNTNIAGLLSVNPNIEKTSDTVKVQLALNYFELGRVYDQLGMQDSAIVFYQKASEITPEDEPKSARFHYVYALSIEKLEPLKADSLMELIVEKYPKTEYGKNAIIKQGYTANYLIDDAEDLFKSGSSLLSNREYNFAITQFLRVFNEHPESIFAPRSLYSLGWLFENDLKNYDSSLFYYQLLIEKYPRSQYAKDVKLPVDYLLALQSGLPIPDSLKAPERKKEVVQSEDESDSTDVQAVSPENEFKEGVNEAGSLKLNPLELIKDPKKLIKDVKETLTDPRLLEMDLPSDPFKDLRPIKKEEPTQEMKPETPPDSTKSK